MKTLTVVFLVASLCMERASSLECYHCQNVNSHNECTKRTKCSDMDRYCVSFYNQPPGKELSISKWCSPHCPKINAGTKEVNTGISSTCCETDYCNNGGPSSVKTTLSLECYKCQKVPEKSRKYCLIAGSCTPVERVCVSLYNKTADNELYISKWCAKECPKNLAESKTGKYEVKVQCCDKNYCNSGSHDWSNDMKADYATMVLATLAILFEIL
ncbi:hypothetical protein JD844_015477 [Phrynosoma platyrhinos]|uniref:UPAR/Ly6 domain-containing protein n=1 Tax=Phrynosoma platyrhinos TaxID=52577 RepID=A0ABQ7SJB4_PHRPL|nr:hypothetical protein JD844_015477 [Phrynosoma platyrhinos]